MENKKNKIVAIIAIVSVLVLLAIILTVKLFNIKNKNKETPTINANSVVEDKISNNVENKLIESNNIVNNNVNEMTNNITDNTIAENKGQENNKEEIDNETIQKEENNKEKAISIAKQNWGEDNKVYFSFDSIDSNGKYIVSVRDKASTEALYWYIVDIEKGTFSIE